MGEFQKTIEIQTLEDKVKKYSERLLSEDGKTDPGFLKQNFFRFKHFWNVSIFVYKEAWSEVYKRYYTIKGLKSYWYIEGSKFRDFDNPKFTPNRLDILQFINAPFADKSVKEIIRLLPELEREIIQGYVGVDLVGSFNYFSPSKIKIRNMMKAKINAFLEARELRKSEGINKAINNGEHTKLYQALFPNELISRETFDQALKNNIDFYDCVKDFIYEDDNFVDFSSESEFKGLNFGRNKDRKRNRKLDLKGLYLKGLDEGVSKRFEMEARIFLAKGELKKALKSFKSAITYCVLRYLYFDKKGEIPYGVSFFQRIYKEFYLEGHYEEAKECLNSILLLIECVFPDQNADRDQNSDRKVFETNYDLKSFTKLKKDILQKLSKVEHENQLAETNKKLQREIEQRNEMVSKYYHSMGNNFFPDDIEKVAKKMIDHPDFSEEAEILLNEFHNLEMVKQQAELLRIEFGASNPAEYQRYILRDRLSDDEKEKGVIVQDVLDYTMRHLIRDLLDQYDVKLAVAREKLVSQNGMDLDALQNDFNKAVKIERKQTSLEWLTTKQLKTQIGELSPLWKEVCLRKSGAVHSVLQNHWREIFFNALKYADHTKEEFLTLRFEEHTAKDNTWLRMVWENSYTKSDKKISSGEGLNNVKANLCKLNNKKSKEFTLHSELKKNQFIVSINYRSDMLLPYKNIEFK